MGDHFQKHWGKWLLGIAAAVVLYYGFRENGWFRAKTTVATTTATK